MKARKAVFAGSWYPGSALGCEKDIRRFLKEERAITVSNRNFIGGIVPHAGWYFSGSIACNVIHCLKGESPPDVFVLFGMHLHSGSPCVMMADGAWETPFGDIQVEKNLAAELCKKFTFHIETAEDFTPDNTIELQLPFIKYFFEDAKIVAIGVPPVKDSFEIGKAVASIAAELGLRIKILGSTDLTHYGSNYGFVPKGTGPLAIDWVKKDNDRRIIDAFLSMDPDRVLKEALTRQNACCPGAAATALVAAKQLGAESAETVAYATSFDKSPGDSFVGYAGVVF